jgi:hypothetical protein
MKHSRLSIVILSALVAVSAELALDSVGNAHISSVQDVERSLDIERYPNEPLELVEIKVGEKSLKHDIKFKSKDNTSKWGRDSVKFKEKDGWFRQVKVRLQNVSGRPIYGIKAGLQFEPSGVKMLFSLLMVWNKNLKKEPLQPGDEIDLEVTDLELERALGQMREYGVDVNLSTVSFSLDDAYFSEDLMWSRGTLLRRAPYDRYKWEPVNNSAPPGTNLLNQMLPGASRLQQPAGFTLVTFNTSYEPPQSATTCTQPGGGRLAYQCDGDYDYCVRIVELGNGSPGSLSAFPNPGQCQREGVSCLTQTTHSRLSYDPSCAAPTPTPTPTTCHQAFTSCNLDSDCCQGNHCNWSYGDQCYPDYTNCSDQHAMPALKTEVI